MSKILSIKGHSTRGNEVIEILEMLGGKNIHKYDVIRDDYVYFLSEKGSILAIPHCNIHLFDCVIFTLEEFLKKYPYKVEDKAVYIDDNDIVVISEIEWDDIVGDIFYNVKRIDEDDCFLCPPELLKPYKETNMNENKFGTAKNPLKLKSNAVKLVDGKCEMTHEDVIFDSIIWHLRNSVNNGKQNLSGGECEDYFREVVKKNNENKIKNVLAELLDHIKNTSKEELEREFEEIESEGWTNVGPTVEEFRTFCESINKKLKYPTTYEECFNMHTTHNTSYFLANKTDALYNLFICRNAYWKIAGEEMGLGKPWEPDWNHINRKFYCIYNSKNNIVKNVKYSENKILAFPTEEMRDAFYENFKDLIEKCKELL